MEARSTEDEGEIFLFEKSVRTVEEVRLTGEDLFLHFSCLCRYSWYTANEFLRAFETKVRKEGSR